MSKVIELEKVVKFYGQGDTRTQVLFDIDLSFEKGSFNSIIGPSGSGKSTLMNILGTLDTADGGKVLINGTETSRMNKDALSRLRNQTVGFIFQFHYLLPEFTVMENILMPLQIAGIRPGKAEMARAEMLLERVGLTKFRNNLSTRLSGGQQQRTAIARALMHQPPIVLADEPTGNLDTDSTDAAYRIMREIHEEMGTTFVIITHDRRIAEKTDRIVEIRDGRVSLDVTR